MTNFCIEIVKFFEKVEECGRWPQQACTTMFDSDERHERTPHRALAHLDWMVKVVACARGDDVARKASRRVGRH